MRKTNEPIGLAEALLNRFIDVWVVEDLPKPPVSNQLSILYSTYNRTEAQEMVARLATVTARMQTMDPAQPKAILCGTGRAGLWRLLAAPYANGVVADCDGLDDENDDALLGADLFCPGSRNIDTFNGALIVASPLPLLLHNTAGKFPINSLKSTYTINRVPKKLRVEKGKLTDEQIAEWISKLQLEK